MPALWLVLLVVACANRPADRGNDDRGHLATVLEAAREACALDRHAPVDVLVDVHGDAQHLVDVLVALDLAGVTMIGLGKS